MTRRASRLAWAAAVPPSVLFALFDLRFIYDFWTGPVGLRRPDFGYYWAGAIVGTIYGWQHLYDHALQVAAIRQYSPPLAVPLGAYIYPPPLAWLLAPAIRLGFIPAEIAWLAVMAAAALAGWWLLAPGDISRKLLSLGALVGFFPFAFAVASGQLVLLALGAVGLSFWALRAGRPVLAGLALVVTVLKPELCFLVLPALLCAGQVRAAAVALAGWAVLAVASLAVLGPSGTSQYLSLLHTVQQAAPQSGGTLQGVVGGAAGIALEAVVVVVTLAVAFGADWRRVIAMAILGSLLATPYLHPDDVALGFAAAWLCLRAGVSRAEVVLMLAALAAYELVTVQPAVNGIGLLALTAWWSLLAYRTLREGPLSHRLLRRVSTQAHGPGVMTQPGPSRAKGFAGAGLRLRGAARLKRLATHPLLRRAAPPALTPRLERLGWQPAANMSAPRPERGGRAWSWPH